MRLAELARHLGGGVLVPRARGLAAASVGGGGAPDVERAAVPETSPLVADVRVDSRSVRPGELFAALPGTREDGRRHAADAARRGACALLCAAQVEGVALPQWIHAEPRAAAGRAAALVHGQPARGQFTIAITGTNGKTTTAHIAGHLLRHVGMRPAVLGTTGYYLAGGELASTHTTPDAPELQRLFARHRRAGGDAAALEVSSHALDQERIAGLEPSVAVFTNLTRDHLDYHGTFERYRAAKARLFESLGKDATAVVNVDDPSGSFMADAARRQGARVVTYSIGSQADLCASRLRTDLKGTNLFVSGMGITLTRLWLPLAGRYNVENALAALAAVLVSGASPSNALDGLAAASPAPGRLESVPTGARAFTLLVDYAHTENALENVCATLRSTLDQTRTPGRGGRLIVVFGCGGDRDRGKRAPMGAVVNRLADVAIVTSDNPRGEDPLAIIDEVCSGMQPACALRVIEPDRALAIRRAVDEARPGDVVLVAGKGHERTQEIGARMLEFDDRAKALEALR